MKKLLILSLIFSFLTSCQSISDYFDAKSVVGKYRNGSGAEVEFTGTKCIGGVIISTYKVENGFIYLDGELGQITRFQIIDKNTIKMITANDSSNAEILYREGSVEEPTHKLVDSTKIKHTSLQGQQQINLAARPLVNQLKVTPSVDIHSTDLPNAENKFKNAKKTDTITDQNISPNDIK